MLGAVTLNGGSSHDRPPENALSMMSPCAPFGVWQLPQVRISVIRYPPRLTKSLFADGALAAPANAMPNATAKSAERNAMTFPHQAKCGHDHNVPASARK